jgi:hypothetical protein
LLNTTGVLADRPTLTLEPALSMNHGYSTWLNGGRFELPAPPLVAGWG